jgi:hypothetical protein
MKITHAKCFYVHDQGDINICKEMLHIQILNKANVRVFTLKMPPRCELVWCDITYSSASPLHLAGSSSSDLNFFQPLSGNASLLICHITNITYCIIQKHKTEYITVIHY